MKKKMVLQFTDTHNNKWTHEYVAFWNCWHCWFYNTFPRFTPKNSSSDQPYVPGTCVINLI